MKTYKVKMRNSTITEAVKADSVLGAMVKYCEKKNLNYRHFAGKLEIEDNDKNKSK
jgi:hypothetical protein